MLARPLLSVKAVLEVTCKIVGMAPFPGLFVPLPPPEDVPRMTVVRKSTLAALTESGGDAESVTRTTTGWNACPVEICPLPDTGHNIKLASGTGLT